jgi:hypothetical protein
MLNYDYAPRRLLLEKYAAMLVVGISHSVSVFSKILNILLNLVNKKIFKFSFQQYHIYIFQVSYSIKNVGLKTSKKYNFGTTTP